MLVHRVCLLCGHALADRPAGRRIGWQDGALGDTCWSLVNVQDKILKIFLWVGDGEEQKALWRDQGVATGEACVQVADLPGQLQAPGQTAQLGTGKERKPIWKGGGAVSLTVPQPEESDNKQKLVYVSIQQC